MRIRFPSRAGIAWAVLGLAGVLHAADAPRGVGSGASRDEVIEAYGWPSGQSQAGGREILSYPQGRVTLEDGRVLRVDFSAKLPWPAPRPRPAPPSPVSGKKVAAKAAAVDPWMEDLAEAQRESARRGAQILALFTGRDSSPASLRFHEQVATHPDFAAALGGDFVFLRLDFPVRTPLPEKLRAQNDALRERHGVTVYPTLLLLSPAGNTLATVDLSSTEVGAAYRSHVIAAIRAARDRVAADAAKKAAASARTLTAPAQESWVVTWFVDNFGLAAGNTFAGAVAASVAMMGGLLVWLLRRTGTPANLPNAAFAVRLSNSAGGVPTADEIAKWPKEKICAVTAALAESEGYVAEIVPPGGGKDLVLKNRGDDCPRVVVFCAAGKTGAVSMRRLRELHGTLAADGAQTGWYVSPNGFANDAPAYAEQHQLHLIDAARMVERLRELPPLLLPKVLPHGPDDEVERKAA